MMGVFNVFSWNIIVLWLLLNFTQIKSYKSGNHVSKRSGCKPQLYMTNCNTEDSVDPIWSWYPKFIYKIEANVERGCSSSYLEFSWTLKVKTGRIKKFPPSLTNPVLYFLRYSLDIGRYVAVFKVNEISLGISNTQTVKCFIRMVIDDSLINLDGGDVRSTPISKTVIIDSTLVDYNERRTDISKFKYVWQVLKNGKIYHIRYTKYPTSIYISKRHVTKDTDFVVFLNVTNHYGVTSSATQLIKVTDTVVPLYIICRKNCPRDGNAKTNPLDYTILEVFCGFHCLYIKDISWNLIDDESKNTITTGILQSEDNSRMIIQPNILKPNSSYQVVIWLGEDTKYATKIIETSTIGPGSCDITSSQKTYLLQPFEIKCTNYTGGLMFQVYQETTIYGETSDILLATNNEGLFRLVLGVGKIMIKIYNDVGYYKTLNLSVVEYHDGNLYPQYLEDSNDEFSIPAMIQNNLQDKTVQVIHSLLLNCAHNKEFVKNFNLKVVVLLKKLFMYNIYEALQLATLTRKLLFKEDYSDPVYQRYLSELCLVIARKYHYHIISIPKRSNYFLTSAEAQKNLLKCANFALNNKYKESNPSELNTNDDEMQKDFIKYEFFRSTLNTIEVIMLSAEATGQSMIVGHFNHEEHLEHFSSISVHLPILLYSIIQNGTKIQLDQSKNMFEEVVLTVTIFKKNIFWWHEFSNNIATAFIDINVFQTSNGIRVTYFDNYIDLHFKIKEKKYSIIEGNINVPADLNDWIPDNLDYNMVVHRIDVAEGSNLHLKFESDDKLQVVVTKERRPHTEDFKTATKINKEGKITIYRDRFKGNKDSWFYVALLPDRSSVKPSNGNATFTSSYKIFLYVQSCLFWDKKSGKWSSFGCKVGKLATDTELHCRCKHLSTLAGRSGGTGTKEDSIIIVPISLELKMNYMIPLFVVIVLVLYFISLIFAVRKTRTFKAREKLMFLADNIKSDRFGYVLIVTTGNRKYAGTTSNICIKIHGVKASSRAHVLNYPDPHKLLLRRGGRDWFVLTDEHYLGNLEEIDLWFDCVGICTSWYCESVHVYDLQNDDEWFFDVKDELTVMKKRKTFIIVESSSTKTTGKWKDEWKVRLTSYNVGNQLWNIFNSSDDCLTYIRKLTILLSTILTTFTASIFILGIPSLRLKDGLTYGHFQIGGMMFLSAFISSITSFLIHLAVQFLFWKAAEQSEKIVEEKHISYINLAWYLLLSLIVFDITILMVFGFWVPYIKVLNWIISVLSGILQIIFLYENIYGFLLMLFRKTVQEPIYIYNVKSIIQEAEKQRNVLYKKFGDFLLRPYLQFKYSPLSEDKIKEREALEKARVEIANLLKELVVFVLFLLLLVAVLMYDCDYSLRMGNQEMKELVTAQHLKTMEIDEVHKYQDIYEYINKTLIPICHPDEWYENYNLTEPGLMVDITNKLMGVVQLRQKRIVENACEVPEPMKELNMNCVPEYNIFYLGAFEDRTYTERLRDIWMYQNSTSTGSGTVHGAITSYNGEGYIVRLGRTKQNSLYTLAYLEENKWIDDKTRVLFIEYWTYNVNSNIFNSIMVLFEKSASGLFITSYNIFTARLITINLKETLFKTLFSLIFCLIFFIYIIIVLKKLFCASFKFFLNFWNVFDVFIITTTICSIGVYFYRAFLTSTLIDTLETSSNNDFVSFAPVMHFTYLIQIVHAMLICMTVIRLWKYLRFGLVFRIMENTIVESRGPILTLFCYHLIAIAAFSLTGFLIFGNDEQYFKNITTSTSTLVLLSLNLYFFDLKKVLSNHGTLGFIFFVVFVLFMLGIYTFYIAIIIMYYQKSTVKFSNLREIYTVKEFVSDEFEYSLELLKLRCKKRLRGGQNKDPVEMVYPKALEHYYANVLIITRSKLEQMSLIARGVIRNLHEKRDNVLTSKELELMNNIVQNLIDCNKPEGERNFFFVASMGKEKKIISERRLQQMEGVVKKLFKKTTERTKNKNATIISGGSNIERIQYFEDVVASISEVFDSITFVDDG